MNPGKYADISEMVLRFKESRDLLIRKSVIQTLPKLARFSPVDFAGTHADASLRFLLEQLQVDRFRTVGILTDNLTNSCIGCWRYSTCHWRQHQPLFGQSPFSNQRILFKAQVC